jgi:deoxyhypusine synthase
LAIRKNKSAAKKSPSTGLAGDGLTAGARRLKGKILSRRIRQLDLRQGMRASDLVDAMADMSIQARNLGACAHVMGRMYADRRRPTVMLGLAGPLIAAGLRKVIRDLVVGGYVDVVVSTGAILYQDIYQARGFGHYRGTPAADDTALRDLRIDRIYDTYVDEEKFIETDIWCGLMADEFAARAATAKARHGQDARGTHGRDAHATHVTSSRAYLDYLGSQLRDEQSIVRQCHLLGVPMFAPAINDSSIGIGLTDHRHRCLQQGREGLAIDSIRDNYELTQIVVKSPCTAAIYVAGGVPKNYINDSVVMSYIFGLERGHDYAIQITTAVTQDGGLSGSTLGEAQSWGKIKKEATFSMAWVEPSVSLPLLAAYVFDKCPRPRKRLKLEWNGQILKRLK